MSLSACYCIKNEEKFIGYSIASIIDVVDEVIVVDEGSRDNTLKIVSSIDNKKIKVCKLDMERYSFADGFRLGIQMARNEWVLIMDGDFVFNDKDAGRIPYWIEKAGNNEEIWALILYVRHFLDLYNCIFNPRNVTTKNMGIKPFIFRKGLCELIGDFGTLAMTFKGKLWREADPGHFLKTDVCINHYSRVKRTYLERVEDWLRRLKNAGLSESEAISKVERLDEIRTDVPLLPYEGIQPEVFKRFNFEGGFDFRPWELYYQGKRAIERDDRERAMECFREAITLDSNFAPAWFYRGMVLLDDGDSQKFSKEIDEKVEDLKKRTSDLNNSRQVKEQVALISILKGVKYFCLREYPKALGYINEALKLTKEYQYRIIFNEMIKEIEDSG